MTKRKGELSAAQIDRRWPHQVAIPDDLCVMENFEIIRDFCGGRSIAPRSRAVYAEWPCGNFELHRVHCFADPADAAAFIERFGGTPFDPARDRVKGRSDRWLREGEYRRVLTSGPLSVPPILRD